MASVNLTQLIQQYRSDSLSVYNTWFIDNEARMKAFRSIRRGVINVISAIKDGTFGTLFSPTAKTSTLGTSNERGTGFGLPLAYRFIKMMHGDIKASCIENPNEINTYITTFSIILPKT